MHKFFVASAIAFVALQAAFAKPAEKSQIDQLAAKAHAVVTNVTSFMDGNLPNSKQVSETLTKTTQELATKFKDAVDNLSKQAQEHKGDIEQVVNQIRENLSTAATKLENLVGTEAVQKAKEMKANLDEGLNKALAEAEKLAKAAEPEATKAKTDLSNAAKTLMDNIIEVGKKLRTDLDKNIAAKN